MSPVVNDKITSHTDVTLKGTVRRVSDLAVVDVTGATIALRYSKDGGTTWVEITPVTIADGPNGRVSQVVSAAILDYSANGTFKYEWRGTLSDTTAVASLDIETLRVRARPG